MTTHPAFFRSIARAKLAFDRATAIRGPERAKILAECRRHLELAAACTDCPSQRQQLADWIGRVERRGRKRKTKPPEPKLVPTFPEMPATIK